MQNRRAFLISSAATAAMSRSAVGANDRIQIGVIGVGVRGEHMQGVMGANPDCAVVAVCDVFQPTREKVAAKIGGNVATYVDYRKLLDRKDIDAVLIAAPDHWHGPMLIDACAAGKDVYCEKPLTHQIEMGWKMIEAVQKHRRVVQIGLQQRHWKQFQECAEMVQGGKIGQVYHAGLHWDGAYTRPPEPPEQPPEGLDWELFQGPAERRPYTPSRQRRWRAYYDYAGGILTDQGVHVADIARWYLGAGAPLTAGGSGQYVAVPCPEKDQLPDAIVVSWQYDKFVMSFSNRSMPNPDYTDQGNYFIGTGGALHVNRAAYNLRPAPPRPGSGGQKPPAFEPINVPRKGLGLDADKAHAREFLDCVKSRNKPTADVETGFYSTLPLLMGVLAIRYGRTFAWDGRAAKAV
ncbi:MAG: Gfo/Idh/MocA family oxidoreductase [Acidobacteria bacterium]|nr:Gfo/Idh/MocA family oxidoreductase [Acidobacteriota bacterium]